MVLVCLFLLLSSILQPQIFSVKVNSTKYGMNEHQEEIGEPVSTPTDNFDSIDDLFGRNDWWLKGADDNWYPYDKYLSRLNGLDRKRERIFGLWVNLTSPNKTTVINRWNDGDASIKEFVNNKHATLGPVDTTWKMPLWLKAQPFRLLCCNNPFHEKAEEFTDKDLDKIFDSSDISQPRSRFLSIETVYEFSPKVVYSKPNTEYQQIFFN